MRSIMCSACPEKNRADDQRHYRGQVAERVRMLDVKCARCDRLARLSLSRLLLELGPDAPVWQAWAHLNHDCPKRDAQCAGQTCSCMRRSCRSCSCGPGQGEIDAALAPMAEILTPAEAQRLQDNARTRGVWLMWFV